MITKHPSVMNGASDLDEIRNVCFQEKHLRDIVFATMRTFFD